MRAASGFSAVLFIVLLVAIWGALVLINTWIEQQGFLEQQSPQPKLTLPAVSFSNSQSFLASKLAAIKLTDLEQNPVNLAIFDGQPLVFVSWASWCPPCLEQLDLLSKIQAEFAGSLTVLAVNRAESLAAAKSFAANNLITLLDDSDQFYQQIGGFLMPELLFIDKQGNLLEHKKGPILNEQELRAKLEALATN